MTASLYNCSAEAEGSFLVTKFDTDLNPEATYALSTSECDCPAGHRATCRHRQMLPLFIGNNHVDDGWFLNWNTRQWHRPVADLQSKDEADPGPASDGPCPLDPAPSSDPTPPTPQEDEAASVGEAASPNSTEKGVASLPSPVQGPEGNAVVSPPAPTKKLIFKRRV